MNRNKKLVSKNNANLIYRYIVIRHSIKVDFFYNRIIEINNLYMKINFYLKIFKKRNEF